MVRSQETGGWGMSESATEQDQQRSDTFRTPEQEQAEKGANTPNAQQIPLEEINPLNAHLFKDNRWQEFFARLRAEDPVHFNEIESAGRYWSLTKYDDIKKVDSDWETFSSAHGITLGFSIGTELPGGIFQGSSAFISQDPPRHDEQRKTVAGVAAPGNLAKMESLIRERTCEVLDSLPVGEAFDWVDTVSIELTTMMLATLFDFPLKIAEN
jgi:cytochrome P450